MKKAKFTIVGMHCASCIEVIKMNLEGKCAKFKSNVIDGATEIEYDEKKTSEKELKELIAKSGYKVK